MNIQTKIAGYEVDLDITYHYTHGTNADGYRYAGIIIDGYELKAFNFGFKETTDSTIISSIKSEIDNAYLINLVNENIPF